MSPMDDGCFHHFLLAEKKTTREALREKKVDLKIFALEKCTRSINIRPRFFFFLLHRKKMLKGITPTIFLLLLLLV